jgi:hypothetical protein
MLRTLLKIILYKASNQQQLLPATSRGFNIEKIYSSLHRSFYYLLQLNQSQQTYQPNAHPPTNTQSPNTTSIYTKHPNNTHHRLHQNSSHNNTFQQHIPTASCSPTAQCSYFHRLFYQKQLMQPNCPMQLFPTTFLSKTAHAAQQKSPPSGCSYFHRLFYQKQLMQQLPTLGVCSYSIKNSSCSPTKIPTLGMQLFPSTFLSKTAHAAIPTLGVCSPIICSYFHRLFYQKQLRAAQQNSPPSVCSPYEGKKGKKITINITITSPPSPPPHYPPPTSPPPPPPPAHPPATCTHSSYQAPTHTHPAPTHFTSSLSYAHKYSSTHNQAISTALPGC